MNNFVPLEGWKDRKPRVEETDSRQTGPKQSLDDVEMEDNKRDIIHREIDKFREIMKLREAEKEEEKKNRDKDTGGESTSRSESVSKRERPPSKVSIKKVNILANSIFTKPGALGDRSKPMTIRLDSALFVGCRCPPVANANFAPGGRQ